MVMTDDEIATSYRQAKNQKQQIAVLADLNGTNTVEMRQHMMRIGLLEPDVLATPTKDSGIDELRAMELFKEGKTDLDIAEMLGVSIHRVQSWRTRNGFLRPRGRSRPKNKPEAPEQKPPAEKKAKKKKAASAPAAEPQPDPAVPAASRSPVCWKFYLVLPPSTPRPGSTVRMRRRRGSMSRPSTARTDVWRLRSIS